MQVLTNLIHVALDGTVQFTGSYGWAIILLTIGLRLAMLPLHLWQQRSAAASARQQVQVKEIQEKYQGAEADRRLREVYSGSVKHLLAGCLPALLQWPVFMAMYGALNSFAIAVPAGFFWLSNLSAPDPYLILPLLAVLTSGWQTFTTVPKQQRWSMLFLPVVMGFFVVKASAAVGLYWVVSNAFSLVQHYLLTRRTASALA